jgi:hypothetical protein
MAGLRESIYKVEEIKSLLAVQQDPTERRLQELQPIDAGNTEKRNTFRASLSQVCFMIQTLILFRFSFLDWFSHSASQV